MLEWGQKTREKAIAPPTQTIHSKSQMFGLAHSWKRGRELEISILLRKRSFSLVDLLAMGPLLTIVINSMADKSILFTVLRS